MKVLRRITPWMVPLTAILLGFSVRKAGAQGQQAAPAQSATAVPNGTRFLVRLEDELNSARVPKNKRFKVHTLEPLEAGNGITIPAGTEIRGHVSVVEPGGLTGRARLWLTFDEIHAPSGKLPIIADVVGVPGEHSVKQGDSKEGEIEARTSKGRHEAESAAAGAAMGAAAGAARGGGKGAVIGAAAGAAAGFLVSSGIGKELDLPKGTKLELELLRPLYLQPK